jgi:protein disulfide-isomerase A6
MKPAWNQLGDEFEGSSSVLIGDADCTEEADLCSKYDVKGYPTIKYIKAGEEPESYSGGRDFDTLKKFVEDELLVKCTIKEQDGCSDKEKKYITKMQAKAADDITKQHTRLTGMQGGKMKAELKQWLNQRLSILKQLKDEL